MKGDKAMFKRFVRYYRPHLGLLILDLLSALLVAGIDLIFPSATRNILNVYIPKNNLKAVYLIGIVLLIFYILRTVFSYIINYWGHMMGARIERDMRKICFIIWNKWTISSLTKTRPVF